MAGGTVYINDGVKNTLIVTTILMFGLAVSVTGVMIREEARVTTGDEKRDNATKTAAEAYENAHESLPKLFKILGQHVVAPIVARVIEGFM
mmetsp:Transcript_40796/g.161632  ORF Transcript_40796/g.161632 Transcript_40796/m.161632 type:complete len:91 (-) Transcript_40796:159-431(-)|eukprot:CAMPEP_0113968450 /NCGR_PEP_ID=MMETSP0011_2-20120614/9545_1 /TAXON_ID=101924 /ORGANISM="Rhodosorus marinus" /LENGTH=90 /DNA_ID=CAMNT_0000981551 /DNA_START=54 /DNA_END=326 /DNA_ORIENTATION=- /assembly_acc=CAM_ASM_000156